jgi:hypothetical protein
LFFRTLPREVSSDCSEKHGMYKHLWNCCLSPAAL